MKSDKLREKCIKLFLVLNNYTQISEITNYSRQYITNLIKDDERIKEYLNKKIVKVYKFKNSTRMKVPISTDFLVKIGIDKNSKKDEYVEINIDEKAKEIIIKKKEKM